MRAVGWIAGLCLCSAAVPATAASVVQVDNETLFLGFDPFDASLGTLNSVTLDVSLWRPRAWVVTTPSDVPTGTTVDWTIDGQWVLPASAGMGGVPATITLTGAGSTAVDLAFVEAGTAFGFFGVEALGSGSLSLDPADFLSDRLFFNGYDPAYLGLADDTIFTVGSGYSLFQLAGACPSFDGPRPESEDYCGSTSYTLTYDYTPAVPEPGTWAMMLLGFAAVGASLRRTRRKVFAAA